MFLLGFNATKCKTQCRLGISRIKLMKNKRTIQLKQLRREVAELLKQGKQGNARIRVESVLREHFMLQAYDILELYLELIAVRAELMAKTKDIPSDMAEAICSLIYAGSRVSTDLNEVGTVSRMLVDKYSSYYKKESGFPQEVCSDLTYRKWSVNDNLVSCLSVAVPPAEEKIRMMKEIAEEFDAPFDEEATALDMQVRKPPPIPAYPTATLLAGGAVGSGPGSPAAAGAGPAGAPGGWAPPVITQPPVAAWGGPPGYASAAGAAGGPGAGVGGAPSSDSGGYVPPGMPTGSTVVARPQGPPGGDLAPGWRPPAPQDTTQAGQAFQSHLGSMAAWEALRRNGGAGGAPPPATAATDYSLPPPAVAAPPPAATAYPRLSQPTAGAPGADGGGTSSGTGGVGAAGGPTHAPGFYVKRSDSEIQRRYDAVPGPPSKYDVNAPAAPSAPSAPPAADSQDDNLAALPGPPKGGPRRGGDGDDDEGGNSAVDAELGDLAKRLEALKRS